MKPAIEPAHKSACPFRRGTSVKALRLSLKSAFLGTTTAAMLMITGPAHTETAQVIFERNFQALADAQPRHAVAAALTIGAGNPYVLVSGNQNTRNDVAVDIDAAWHIGSVTKSLTAALVMRLVERGQLDLDAPIGDYLPQYRLEMHPDWQSLTLRQLLSHTGNVPRDVSLWGLFFPSNGDPTRTRVTEMQKLWNKPLQVTDGSFQYSNIGYALVGAVVENVTQEAWFALLKREITDPLGLDTVGLGPPTNATAPWGHTSRFGVSRPIDPTSNSADNPAWMGPAGTLRMSMSDLAKWGQIQLAACQGERPDFLSKDSCIAMQTPVAIDYGMGWVIQPVPGFDATLVWHNGSNTKWYTFLAMIPEHEIVFAVSLNHFDEGPIDVFAKSLIQELLETL